MKKIYGLLVVLFFVLAVSACSIAPAEGEVANPTDVNAGQMYIVGVIATAILYGVKLIAQKYPKVVIKRNWLTVLLYVIALALSVVWGGMTIPSFEAFSDPVTFVASVFGWVTALLLALAPSVSFATLIYNLLLKRVFDGLSAKG